MNGNCRNNTQAPNYRIGMLNSTNFLTQSIGNFIQNTANMFLNPTQYSQNQNYRHFSTNSSRLNKPQEAYTNITPYTTAFININNSIFNHNPRHYNKYSGFNQQMDGMGHRLGHSFNRNNFKSGCDESLENSHFNQYRNRKFQKMNPGNCNNKNWRDGCNKRGYKTSEKYKTFINGNAGDYYTQGRDQNRRQNIRYNNNNNNHNRLLQNKSDVSCNNNSRPAEVVAIFTLEDFPELPVPKRHKPWSFNFPGSCKSKSNCITAEIINKNQRESSPKIKPSNNNIFPNISKTKNKINSQKTDKHDFMEDNFVIIMDRNSPQFKHNSNSTAGFTPFKPRQRQISECSDDSFIICFTNDAADGVIELDLLSSDDDMDHSDSDDDDNEDDDDDDGDEDNDVIDNHVIENKSQSTPNNSNKNKKNSSVPTKKTENLKTISNNLETLCLETTSQPDSGFDDIKEKKVRFQLEPEIHVMHTWDYAYRAARKGEWESYARDRCRFKNRIDRLGPTISAILDDQHRRKIFNERFSNEIKYSNV